LKVEIAETYKRLKQEYMEMQGRERNYLIDSLPLEVKRQIEDLLK
jgi:hypothetical protein